MNTSYKAATAFLAVLASVSLTSVAKANCSSGFIADVLCQTGVINKQTANGLDAAHAGLGRPLDHMANQAAGAAANYVVPGSGMYVTQGLEMRDQFNRGGFGGGMGAPVGGPIPVNAPMPINVPMMPPMGGVCSTQYGTAFVNMQPIGSFCQVAVPGGWVGGQIIQ